MGKRGRAKARRNRDSGQGAPVAAASDSQVHVTVATVPRGDITGSLAHDAALVKAALLYADHVTLASPNAIMLAGVAGLTNPDSQDRRDALMSMASVLPGSEDAVALYHDLKRRRTKLSPAERLVLSRIEQVLKTSGDEMAETVSGMLQTAGMPELQVAIEAGVLGIHMLDLDQAAPDEFATCVIDGLVKVLTDAVSSTSRTFPMFDDGAGSLVKSMVAEGLVTDVRASRSKEAGAAGQLIAQLEAFPAAEMDVVLDVRKQLKLPLVRFRSALARVSREIESPAWESAAFGREVDDLYRQHVAPALAELTEAMQQLGALPTLRRVASDSKTVVSASALFLTAAAGVGLAQLPNAVFGLGAAGSITAAASSEAERRSQVRRQLQSNDFYFLYAAGRQLSA